MNDFINLYEILSRPMTEFVRGIFYYSKNNKNINEVISRIELLRNVRGALQ